MEASGRERKPLRRLIPPPPQLMYLLLLLIRTISRSAGKFIVYTIPKEDTIAHAKGRLVCGMVGEAGGKGAADESSMDHSLYPCSRLPEWTFVIKWRSCRLIVR